ncbi:unnamed protein product [Gongylonema pulchrum]|uniref:DNA translocase FtsK n=1 Tax=Gongylonema pulchrum TaxID=637853 RepID=A0A183EIR3_9BILA|nr:unnamed protein product [Gongylonema pulchrum]
MNRRERRSRFDQKAVSGRQQPENDYDDIYHARPDDDEPSYFVYDEEEYGIDRDEQERIEEPEMFDDASLIPTAPYYDLPAGMMMPLIDMEDVLVRFYT